eukprot:2597834-Amphidinium_carterae.1
MRSNPAWAQYLNEILQLVDAWCVGAYSLREGSAVGCGRRILWWIVGRADKKAVTSPGSSGTWSGNGRYFSPGLLEIAGEGEPC